MKNGEQQYDNHAHEQWAAREARLLARLFQVRQRFLFVLLLLLVIFVPQFGDGIVVSAVIALLEIAVVLGGVYAASLTNRRLAFGLLLALPAVITTWGSLFQPSPRLELARMFSVLVISCYCFSTIINWIFSSRRTGIEELFGAVNSYILIALSFSFIYWMLEQTEPGSFELKSHAPTAASFMYYSFSTLETVGYGDIAPIRPLARSISVIEAMVGLFFMAALIGHLVSTLPKRRKDNRPAPGHHHHIPAFLHPPVLTFFNTVVLVVLLDSLIPVFGSLLDMPFYFDTWGTMVGVMLGGPWAGAVGGVTYNLLAFVVSEGASSWVWAFSNLLVAVLTYYWFRRNWVDIHRPVRLLLSGACIGTACALVALAVPHLVTVQLYNFETVLYRLVARHVHSPGLAHAVEQLAVDWMDKVISICVAAVIVLAVREFHLARAAGRDAVGTPPAEPSAGK